MVRTHLRAARQPRAAVPDLPVLRAVRAQLGARLAPVPAARARPAGALARRVPPPLRVRLGAARPRIPVRRPARTTSTSVPRISN
ncbi:MAG: hypothetical protein MZW92_50885 [Comamonadaceae bacterium]|nr:hypothetical protein [Comamonadaceae bacterium]